MSEGQMSPNSYSGMTTGVDKRQKELLTHYPLSEKIALKAMMMMTTQ